MEVDMPNYLWQRLGAASGIVSVIILTVRDFIPSREYGTAAEEIARTCATITTPQTMDVVISLMGTLGFLGFLFFFGSLWSALRRAEGDDGWLAATAFGGGLLSLAIVFSGSVASVAAHSNACAGIDPQLWQILHDIGGAAFISSFFPLAVLPAASAVVAIRFGALPPWLGWMSAFVAVMLLIGGVAGIDYAREDAGLPYPLFELWTVITSIVLMRRAGQLLPTVSTALTSPVNDTG
jgi:hypothetical protein